MRSGGSLRPGTTDPYLFIKTNSTQSKPKLVVLLCLDTAAAQPPTLTLMSAGYVTCGGDGCGGGGGVGFVGCVGGGGGGDGSVCGELSMINLRDQSV